MRAVLRIAAFDLRAVARERGTWATLLLLPLVQVLLIVLVPGYLTEREQHQRATAVYDVALQGDAADVDALLALFRSRGWRPVASEDAARAVTRRDADVGVVARRGASSALSGDGTASLEVVTLGTRQASRAAAGRAVALLEATSESLAADRVTKRGLPPTVVLPFEARFVDLADTHRGARLEFANFLPMLLLLPLTGAVGLAAQRISGGKDQRVLEPLLVLPVSRRVVLAGKAAAGYAFGCAILPAVVIPLALGRVLPVGGAGRAVSLPTATLVAVLGVGVVVLAFLVALGACAGAASRSSTEVTSMLPFVSFPIVILAVGLQLVDVQATPLLSAAPVLGPALLSRDIVAGTATAANAAAAVVATLAWSAALVFFAARFLERERSVLRATT